MSPEGEIAMRKSRHTLIRLRGAPTTSPFFSARGFPNMPLPAGAMEPASLSIEEIEATDAELIELAQEQAFVGAPRAFPIALIAPVATVAAAAAGVVAWGIAEVGADVSAFDGSGARVSVLDTGIDAQHPAFAGMVLDQADFTGSGNGDGHGHGTHCAGTIFGRDVAGMRIGVARGVTDAMIGKVLDGNGRGDSTMLFRAIAWAINGGANVISMSLGFDFPGFVDDLVNSQGLPVPMATSIALREYTANLRAFDALMLFARSQIPFTGGSVVIAASGNESQHAKFPISASVPAAADGVVSVGAVRAAVAGVEIAPFSNTDCQVVAPGVSVLSAKAGGGTVALSGTSMACPHAAGVAALWRQALIANGLPANATSLTAKLLAGSDKSRIGGYSHALHGNGVVKAP
jgi:subtilisin family serine protease